MEVQTIEQTLVNAISKIDATPKNDTQFGLWAAVAVTMAGLYTIKIITSKGAINSSANK